MQFEAYKIGCGSCELFLKFFYFCNQWKSAAWWLQDRISVVWASFFNCFFFSTNGKVQVDCDKIGCRSCELLFSSFFFFAANRKVQLDGYKIECRSCELLFSIFFCNQWKSAAWWLRDRMSVVWASFFKFFFAANGKVQLDGYKIECRSCVPLFSSFFLTNGKVQFDGHQIGCRSCELFFKPFFLQPMEKCSLMVTR